MTSRATTPQQEGDVEFYLANSCPKQLADMAETAEGWRSTSEVASDMPENNCDHPVRATFVAGGTSMAWIRVPKRRKVGATLPA